MGKESGGRAAEVMRSDCKSSLPSPPSFLLHLLSWVIMLLPHCPRRSPADAADAVGCEVDGDAEAEVRRAAASLQEERRNVCAGDDDNDCALLRQKLARDDDALNRRRLSSSRGSVCGLQRHASAAAMTPGAAAASFEVCRKREAAR